MKKKKQFLKERNIIQLSTGWGRMFYCFDDLDRHDSWAFLSYLIDTEPVVKCHCFDQGYEDYLEYSDSYIQYGLSPNYTKAIINANIEDLIKHDYIYRHYANNNPHCKRYLKLNYEKIEAKIAASCGLDTETEIDENGIRRY